MPPNEPAHALCVSLHDVAPHTWPQCAQLLQAVRAVAPIPVTLLVVPAYHRLPVVDAVAFDRWLDGRLALGDELALHGFTHLDEGPQASSWQQAFLRRVYTTGEGEFSALDAAEAQRRITQGLAWFAQRHWPVAGFVAPAWLLSPGAWRALCQFRFCYTTTLRYFYILPQVQALLARLLAHRPLVRLGLHPNDAAYPQLISDFQKLIERLLVAREALTKAQFALRLQALYRESASSAAPGAA